MLVDICWITIYVILGLFCIFTAEACRLCNISATVYYMLVDRGWIDIHYVGAVLHLGC